MSAGPGGRDERPVLRLVRGDATPEEIAAIVAVLSAASGAPGEEPDDGTTSSWAAHGHAHRHIRASFTASRHGWRTSLWPG